MVKAEVKVNTDDVLKRFKSFTKELMKLCEKYGLEPEVARDDETKDNFIIVNVKDFIQEKDIKMSIKK